MQSQSNQTSQATSANLTLPHHVIILVGHDQDYSAARLRFPHHHTIKVLLPSHKHNAAQPPLSLEDHGGCVGVEDEHYRRGRAT